MESRVLGHALHDWDGIAKLLLPVSTLTRKSVPPMDTFTNASPAKYAMGMGTQGGGEGDRCSVPIVTGMEVARVGSSGRNRRKMET